MTAPRNDWYRTRYRRLLVDMHIPGWDKRFLSKLDPGRYVDTVASSRAGVMMLYANSHIGLALYPSKLGPVHPNLRKGDFVGRTVDAAHRKDMAVVAYYSVVYNNAAFLDHPDWRIVPPQGPQAFETYRYGVCCPNSPYRQFALAQADELCRSYPFDGIFFDMLFWPFVCYCPHCRERFQSEEGSALPEVVDWHHPTWNAFQRARERWMAGFAGDLTATVRRARPSMTCTHQMSPVLAGWRCAMPYSITEHCDYATGDFYGPPVQQSVVCKIFAHLSVGRPFEFMTSRCVNLWDHVTVKPESEMAMQAFLAPAHGAGFMFIDAINPDGSLLQPVYDQIGRVFSALRPYERFLGGTLLADVAIYVSDQSRFDFHENGRMVRENTRSSDNMSTEFCSPHMAAVMGAAEALQQAHIPYSVVTRLGLDDLCRHRVLIIPHVLLMDDVEMAAIRKFVAGGGAVYASGATSLTAPDGRVRHDFGLRDLFGVSTNGPAQDSLVFLAPEERELAASATPQEQWIHRSGWMDIRNRNARILARFIPPWYPEEGRTVLRPSYASIHSVPPGMTKAGPAITWKKHAKGRVCYSAAPFETERTPVNRAVFTHLIRRLLDSAPGVEADGPAHLELTVMDKPEQNRCNIALTSLLQQHDPLPAKGTIRVRLPGRRPVAVRLLPSRRKVPTRAIPGGISFHFDDVTIFRLFELEYKPTH